MTMSPDSEWHLMSVPPPEGVFVEVLLADGEICPALWKRHEWRGLHGLPGLKWRMPRERKSLSVEEEVSSSP